MLAYFSRSSGYALLAMVALTVFITVVSIASSSGS